MRLLGSVPVLSCSDVEHSLEFYQQALQFIVLNKRVGDRGLEWVYLQSGDTLLMLEQREHSAGPDLVAHNRLYFYTDDVSAMRHYLKAKGYEVGPMLQTAYMEEFDLVDPDGQRISIGQQLKHGDNSDV
jgi:catechol 2,3-dioxygenase-like lactoylglutathione lyase family enzyme